MSIAAEAAELMELFLWVDGKESNSVVKKESFAVESEIADIAWMVLCFCNSHNIDLATAINNKLAINVKKYPIEKAKGRHEKYTKL